MSGAKDLLLQQVRQAFAGDQEMSLQASLEGLTQAEASWRLNATTWTIEEILHHVATCKLDYCRGGFGGTLPAAERAIGDVARTLEQLERAQAHLVACLEALPEEDLDRPLDIPHHGESAAHFFSVMQRHDVSHAAQIRTIRRAYGSRTHFYEI